MNVYVCVKTKETCVIYYCTYTAERGYPLCASRLANGLYSIADFYREDATD